MCARVCVCVCVVLDSPKASIIIRDGKEKGGEMEKLKMEKSIVCVCVVSVACDWDMVYP